MRSVKAKFRVNSVTDFGKQKQVNLMAVYGTGKENSDFSKATPSGTLQMTIDEGTTAAADFFVPGEEVYLEFYKESK